MFEGTLEKITWRCEAPQAAQEWESCPDVGGLGHPVVREAAGIFLMRLLASGAGTCVLEFPSLAKLPWKS